MEGRELHVGVEHELLLCLEKAGLDNRLAQWIIHSNGNQAAERLVSFLCGDLGKTLIWQEALEIVGENGFFGPAKLAAHLGKRVNVLEEWCGVPWSEEAMSNPLRGQSQFLYFVPPTIGGSPVTVRNLIKIFLGPKHPKFDDAELNPWRASKWEFMDARVAPGWHCIVAGPTIEWTGRPYGRQRSFIPGNYENPSTGEVVVAQVFYYLLNGGYMTSDLWMLTRDVAGFNHHIRVKASAVDGICISDWGDDETSLSVGIAAARKLWAS